MTAIYKKEMRNYFNTIIGYVFLGIFVLVTAYFFCMNNIIEARTNYNDNLLNTVTMFLIIIPIMTMRLFAEEAKQKTDQLLYTSPVSVFKIVLGKFLAASSLFLIGVLITCIFPVILSFYGDVPVMQTIGGIFGYFLFGCGLISIGVFISVLTDNQIIAAVGTFIAIFFVIVLDGIAENMPIDTASSVAFMCILAFAAAFLIYNGTKNIYAGGITAIIGFAIIIILYAVNPLIFDSVIVKVLSWFSLLDRFFSFYMGIFSIGNVVYLFTFICAFLYLTINVIEKRRWR